MKACDIGTLLSILPKLTITSDTTAEQAEAAFPMLASFNQGGIFVGHFSGLAPWERHTGGDELLYLMEGESEITVLTESKPVQITLRAGSVFVVPQGLWHRQLAREGATLLSATPQPSEISIAEDPRKS
ncbi:MAG: cupin domain-containing protein [Acidobacteriota bacterium]